MTDERQKELEKNSEKMVQELLAEVDKTVPQISYVSEPINPSDKKAIRKYERKYKKQIRQQNERLGKEKPATFVSIASFLSKIFPIIMTVYTLLIIPIIFTIYELYKLGSTDGWQAIFHTPKTLYVIGYIIIFFVLRKLQLVVYEYAND